MCREGFAGRRCDRCAGGYFNFPRCERCNCNRAGSLPANGSEPIGCDDDGQCVCKALVTGPKCDTCVASAFGLSPTNVDGCTRCYCFGRAQQCGQSALSWGLIRAGDERHLCIEYQHVEFVAIQTISNELAESYDDNLHTVNALTVIPNTKGGWRFWAGGGGGDFEKGQMKKSIFVFFFLIFVVLLCRKCVHRVIAWVRGAALLRNARSVPGRSTAQLCRPLCLWHRDERVQNRIRPNDYRKIPINAAPLARLDHTGVLWRKLKLLDIRLVFIFVQVHHIDSQSKMSLS